MNSIDHSVKHIFYQDSTVQYVECRLFPISRAPITEQSETMSIYLNNYITTLHSEIIFEISSENLSSTALVRETELDQDLQKIKRKLLSTSRDLPYTLENGILFKETRFVIRKTFKLTSCSNCIRHTSASRR